MDKTLVEPTPRTDDAIRQIISRAKVEFEPLITRDSVDILIAHAFQLERELAEQTRLAEERKREVPDGVVLEQTMIMTSEETDELVRIWGMDDIDRALQNMELERQRLARALSGTKDALKLERESVERLSKDAQRYQEAVTEWVILQDKIRATPKVPHSDYWHQSLYEAEQKLRAAIEAHKAPVEKDE